MYPFELFVSHTEAEADALREALVGDTLGDNAVLVWPGNTAPLEGLRVRAIFLDHSMYPYDYPELDDFLRRTVVLMPMQYR